METIKRNDFCSEFLIDSMEKVRSQAENVEYKNLCMSEVLKSAKLNGVW